MQNHSSHISKIMTQLPYIFKKFRLSLIQNLVLNSCCRQMVKHRTNIWSSNWSRVAIVVTALQQEAPNIGTTFHHLMVAPIEHQNLGQSWKFFLTVVCNPISALKNGAHKNEVLKIQKHFLLLLFSGMWLFLLPFKHSGNFILSYFFSFAVNMLRFFNFNILLWFRKVFHTTSVNILKIAHIFHECKIFRIQQTAPSDNGQFIFSIS